MNTDNIPLEILEHKVAVAASRILREPNGLRRFIRLGAHPDNAPAEIEAMYEAFIAGIAQTAVACGQAAAVISEAALIETAQIESWRKLRGHGDRLQDGANAIRNAGVKSTKLKGKK